MSNLTVLRSYARADPSTLPASVLLTHTASSLTLFDAYPKSNTFHFLLLPRIVAPFSAADLRDLGTLLRGDKERARACIEGLARDAEEVKNTIKKEMTKQWGFEWPIFTGFHAIPSMEHLHLHIIASDLFADTMKHKKHYNSFHPKLGFFLHLDDVLEWFDAVPSHYKAMTRFNKTTYEALLKEDLVCWRCDEVFKTIPRLKEHLRSEWGKDHARAQARKRKGQPKDDAESIAIKKD